MANPTPMKKLWNVDIYLGSILIGSQEVQAVDKDEAEELVQDNLDIKCKATKKY